MDKKTKFIILVIAIIIILLILLYIYSKLNQEVYKESCQGLLKLRKKIFPFQIHDVSLLNDLHTEKYYRDVINITNSISTKPTTEQIYFLLKYKKFLEMDGIYSMCSPSDVGLVLGLMKDLENSDVDGDLVETGVWKGGMGMWMQGIMKKCKMRQRKIWLFDTFESFPGPDDNQCNQKDSIIHSVTDLLYNKGENSTHSIDQVKGNFKKFDLYDDNLKFVRGDILETIPVTEKEIEKIALLRIDSDYYSSVKLTLEYLYDKIVKGGYVIIDDYNNPVVGAKEAVDEFRHERGITEDMKKIDGSVFWKIQ